MKKQYLIRDEIGIRYGKLVVINKGIPKSNGTTWICKCDCGNIIQVRTNSLHTNKTKSCGCLNKERALKSRKGILLTYRHIFNVYKRNARQRKLKFNISFEEFLSFLDKPCHYCGDIKTNRCNPYITNAIFEATTILNLDYINISGGGPEFLELESNLLNLYNHTTFVAAAGNENQDLDKHPYYPASYPYPNVIAVGALDKQGNKLSSSNYGKQIKIWELGEDVKSTCINGKYCLMSGTSMAAPQYLGKLIKKYVESH